MFVLYGHSTEMISPIITIRTFVYIVVIVSSLDSMHKYIYNTLGTTIKNEITIVMLPLLLIITIIMVKTECRRQQLPGRNQDKRRIHHCL